MSDVVGTAEVRIEPTGLDEFETELDRGVAQALEAVQSGLQGIDREIDDAVSSAGDLRKELASIDVGAIDLDTSQLAQEVSGAIDAADTDIVVNADTADIPTEVSGAVDAADSEIVVVADAANVPTEIDGAVDAANTDVVITADTAEIPTQIDGAVDAADTAISVTIDNTADIAQAISGAVDSADTTIDLDVDSASLERANQSTNNLATGLKGLAAIVATVGVIDFFRDSAEAASSLQEATTKTQAVFQEFSGEIEAFAADAAVNFGLSEAAALDATSTFGNLFTSLGLSREAAAELSPQFIALAADLASFNDLAGGTNEALVALRAGTVGEIEPLRRLGISFTDMEVRQRAVNLGLAETTAEVTDQAKVLAATN